MMHIWLFMVIDNEYNYCVWNSIWIIEVWIIEVLITKDLLYRQISAYSELVAIVGPRWVGKYKILNTFAVLRAINAALAPIVSAWKCASGTINLYVHEFAKVAKQKTHTLWTAHCSHSLHSSALTALISTCCPSRVRVTFHVTKRTTPLSSKLCIYYYLFPYTSEQLSYTHVLAAPLKGTKSPASLVIFRSPG